MSRTFNTRPNRIKYKPYWDDEEKVPYTVRYVDENGRVTKEYTSFTYLRKAGLRPKKKRNVDTEEHWMTTPMWWIRETMNQPQRVAGKQWERWVVKQEVEDLEDIDTPSVGRKPHNYYW